MSDTYAYPVEVDGNYEVEPSDAQCRVLLRALWHYANAYEDTGIREMKVGDLIDDLVHSSQTGLGMTRDEWVEIGRATGVPV